MNKYDELFDVLKSYGYDREVDISRYKLVSGEQRYPITVGDYQFTFTYYFIRYPVKEAYALRMWEMYPLARDNFGDMLKRIQFEEQAQMFYAGWTFEPGNYNIGEIPKLVLAKALWRWLKIFISETISSEQPEFFKRITKQEGMIVAMNPIGFLSEIDFWDDRDKDPAKQRASMAKRYGLGDMDQYGYVYGRLNNQREVKPI